jgi:hypothetical protein
MNKRIESVVCQIDKLRKELNVRLNGANTVDILTNISDSFRELSELEAQLDFLIASAVEE